MASITDDKDSSRNVVSTKMDVTELFALLESKESNIVEEVMMLVHENLNSSRDSWLLYALVDYYMVTKSSRSLDILIGIRQPHDKHLFDKLSDCLKQEPRDEALHLLGHIVRRQPSWLHKIASHKVFVTLLNMLKTDISAPNLMNGVLIIITLLPIIPSLVGPHLPDIFEIFSRLCAWSTQKPGNVPEVYFLHLRVPLYVLFQLLYTMYPCNFLAYLRLHYGGRDHGNETQNVFTETIKPMLERVRLHPLLVTASKETELQMSRWKNLEPHDIIVQCGALSLDEVASLSETNSVLEIGSKSLSSKSRISNINIPVEPGSLLYDITEALTISVNPTPLAISDLSPSGVNEETEATSSLNEDITSNSQVGPSEDDVIEIEAQKDETDGVKEDESKKRELATGSDVVQAEEAIEQSAISEPKMGTNKSLSKESQFQSTTNTLTTSVSITLPNDAEFTNSMEEEAHNSIPSLPSRELDKEASTSTGSGASSVLIERLVHGINRLRFFSHCGHPPEIPIEWIKRTSLLSKSYSWPNLTNLHKNNGNIGLTPSTSVNVGVQLELSSSLETTPILDVPTPAMVSPKKGSTTTTVPTSCQGAKVLVDSCTVTSSALKTVPTASKATETIVQSKFKPETKFSMLSPSEVLDRHLQLGCEIYMNELKTMSLTNMKDTDWTHFGGPPPVDELNILRGQISLLHMQVLFERHRREVHAERNRRLLGKAKKSRTLEEQNMAMREQMILQEEEIQNLNKILREKEAKLQQMNVDAAQKALQDILRQRSRENDCLNYTNKELQTSLDKHQHEIRKLEKILDDERGRIMKLELDLSDYNKVAERCSQLEGEVKKLTRQQAVLSELHHRYVDKQNCMTKPPDLEYELQELKKSYKEEITDLKLTIRSQINHIDAYKSKIECLEIQLCSKESIIEEHKQLLERVKSINEDQVNVLKERVKSLQSACQTQEQRILFLNHKLCIQDSQAVPRTTNVDDITLAYPVHWHPAQTDLSYGIAMREDDDGRTRRHTTEGAVGNDRS